MKKLVLVAVAFVFLLAVVRTAMAAKPAGNLAVAEKVPWNLSGAVMPVPPWGLHDIIGSDTASKLIVNQPNGNTEVTITGVMNGLNPNTTYTVYLSNKYTKFTGWSVIGDWSLRWVVTGGGAYDHDMFITFQKDGSFSGTAKYPAGGPYTIIEPVTGTIGVTTSGSVTIHITQPPGTYYSDSTGTIDRYGKMSGTWTDSNGNLGIFSTLSGNATPIESGSTSYPGLFTSTVPTFTFVTDAYGSGSWHINLTDANFPPEAGTYTLSVWINAAGGTLLISDNFDVVSN